MLPRASHYFSTVRPRKKNKQSSSRQKSSKNKSKKSSSSQSSKQRTGPNSPADIDELVGNHAHTSYLTNVDYWSHWRNDRHFMPWNLHSHHRLQRLFGFCSLCEVCCSGKQTCVMDSDKMYYYCICRWDRVAKQECAGRHMSWRDVRRSSRNWSNSATAGHSGGRTPSLVNFHLVLAAQPSLSSHLYTVPYISIHREPFHIFSNYIHIFKCVFM